MTRYKVRVEGLKELAAALDELKPSTGKNVLRRVGRLALEPFDDAWRSRAPTSIDGGFYHMKHTGDVGSRLTKNQRKLHRRQSEVEVHAGPGPDPAAVQQEFGNARHPAQPFVRPAWDATKGQVLEIVRTLLRGEIAKAAARAARRAVNLKR